MSEVQIYLFTGPELGEKNEAIENLQKAAEKKYGQLDVYKYFASDVRIADVVAQLQNVSLFSSSLFIVLRNAELIKLKAEIDLLSSWIKGAAESTNTLILVSDENSVEKKLDSLVPSNHKKIFWEMFESKKNVWVQNFFKKNGLSISNDAVEQILDMVENNTESLKIECSKFFCLFEKDHTITCSDVDKILSHNREENAFTLFDAMTENTKSSQERFENCIEILNKIKLSKDSNGTSLIAGLTYCFRQLRLWNLLHSKDSNPSESVLKSNGFTSVTKKNQYTKASKTWSQGAVSSILALLTFIDMKIRDSGTQLEETYLTLLVYSIVIKNGLFPQEYEFSTPDF